ncbi:putative ABC transport system permease protein [Catenuloplanes nepalensis]|uniref:ABC transport system permease protein n=1 Tax=Catenuloplanes nepalensis TaxID=587533 RepID=A0ABT9N1Q4_9ACTN|nr:ABC transporter permease [Catenuloplanes nepalensis]MDP9797371.1 putative ABC transport system permease protein [Catenuloplanes nepalensis]
MRNVLLSGLRARRTRLLLTALAVALGVAFVSGTLILTDTMTASLYQEAARDAKPVAARATAGGRFTDDDLARVAALPGVTDAAGEAAAESLVLDPDGRVVSVLGATATMIRALPDRPELSALRLTAGTFPGPGEAVVDSATAAERGWKPGDSLSLATNPDKPHPVRISALAEGVPYFTVFVPVSDFRAATGVTGWGAIRVAGPDQRAAADTVADALPGAEVITGAEYADRLAGAQVGSVTMMRAGLLGFALVALVVAAMVIHNTFAILVAQRERELALLRLAGALRGQLFRLVLAEAAIVGGLASAAGLGLGLLAGQLGATGLTMIGNGQMTASTQVTPLTVLLGALTGVGVTVLAAIGPARSATRLAPIAALRRPDAPVEAATSRRRALAGALLALVAAAMVSAGALGNTVVLAAAGAAPAMLALVALGPVLVVPAWRLAVRPALLLFGSGGRLAARSGERQPRRAAATALALTVGITVVTTFLVGAQSLATSSTAELQRRFPTDFVVAAPDGRRLPADLAGRLAALPEVQRVEEREGLWVFTEDGVDAAAARGAVASVTDTVPLAVVTDVQSRAEQIGRTVDMLLAVVGTLVVFSVLISVAGITNTLTLSVLERTREFGLLRALGLSRRQLRASLLAEGMTLALIAAVTGVVLGIAFGVAGVYASIPHAWVAVSLPYPRIGLVVLGAAVIGLLAAVLPARRAARVAPIAALADE